MSDRDSYCAARKKDGTLCRQPKGVEREKAEARMRTYGSPIDVEPHVALLEEVRRTAGHVA